MTGERATRQHWTIVEVKQIWPTTFCGYLARDGFESQLEAGLDRVFYRHGRLLLAEGDYQASVWAANVWRTPAAQRIESIGSAAKRLSAIQRNWWPYVVGWHRRSQLIQEKLPHVSGKPLPFPSDIPTAPLGSWTLLSETELLYSADCSSLFPNGEVHFEEDKLGPPNRAYLKLWEALVRMQRYPQPTDTCLELGASPGGWTYVLARLGAKVIAIDRAPLAANVAEFANVEFRVGDAFKATPKTIGKVDWVISDVICYPDKMLAYVRDWLAAPARPNIIVTVKFQGEGHYGIIDEFLKIEGSKLVHLTHNKHELTFISLKD